MDECLSFIVNQNIMDDWQPVIEEMKGQFAWIAGTFIIYQAQQVTLLSYRTVKLKYLV